MLLLEAGEVTSLRADQPSHQKGILDTFFWAGYEQCNQGGSFLGSLNLPVGDWAYGLCLILCVVMIMTIFIANGYGLHRSRLCQIGTKMQEVCAGLIAAYTPAMRHGRVPREILARWHYNVSEGV